MADNNIDLINTTMAGMIAKKLDKKDGAEDGKIKASIWNDFIGKIGTGKEIQDEISVETALKSITTYAVRKASGIAQTATELAKEWCDTFVESIAEQTPSVTETQTTETQATETQAAETTENQAPTPIEPPAPIDPLSPIDPPKPIAPSKIRAGKDVAEKLFNNVDGLGSKNALSILVRDVYPSNALTLIAEFNNLAQESGQQITRFLHGEMTLSRESRVIPAKKLLNFYEGSLSNEKVYQNLNNAVNNYVKDGGNSNAIAVDNALTALIKYIDDNNIEVYYLGEFDANGNRTKGTYYNSDGTVEFEYHNEYDAKGNKTKETRYNPDGTVQFERRYEYDASGNETKETRYNPDGTVNYEYRTEYDAKGNETKDTRYNPDGTVVSERHYEYDASGNETKATMYNSDGMVGYVQRYEYDTNGKKTKETKYDANGNKTEDKSYRPDGTVDHEYHYEYDSNGNQTKKTSYLPDGTMHEETRYEYDANGKLKTMEHACGTGGIVTKTEYDADGNMVKETKFDADGNEVTG